MPKDDPDPSDPLALRAVAVPDPDGAVVREMAACVAEEFLRLGFAPAEVRALFRSPRYSLAHHAWRQLGDAEVGAIVAERASCCRPADHRSFPC